LKEIKSLTRVLVDQNTYTIFQRRLKKSLIVEYPGLGLVSLPFDSARAHEKEIHRTIALLHSQTGANETPKPLTPVIQSIAEDYPELGAGNSFLELQETIEETEQRIAMARDYYNQLTQFFNKHLEIIPDMFIARLGGLKKRRYWIAEEFERTPDMVEFSV